MSKHLLLFSFLLNCFIGYSQQQLSLFGLDHLMDHQVVNPAYFGEHTYELSVFPFASNIYSNGPAYQDFIGSRSSDNVLRYPAEKLAFSQDNLLRAGSAIETFRLLYTKKDWAFSLNHAAKARGLLDYSGALLNIAIEGNAPFIGQQVPINTSFSVLAYEEIGLGIAKKIGKVKIGGRLKYLSGHSIAMTRRSTAALFTDDDIYQLSLDLDTEVNVAGQKGSTLSQFNFGPLDLNFANNDQIIIQSPELIFNLNNDLFNFSGNHGLAFDLGLDWQINDQWNVSFSGLDIGSINWTDNPRNYKANQTFEFDGLSLGQLTFDGNETISFDNAQDSIDVIDFAKTTTSFSSNLPAQFFLGLRHHLNDQWQFNGTFYYTSYLNNSFTALSLGANYQFHKHFNIGLTYGLMNEASFLLGLNATVNLGPLQLYALTDNLLGVFDIENSRTINARVGLGFSFGD